MSDLVFF